MDTGETVLKKDASIDIRLYMIHLLSFRTISSVAP